MIYAKPLPPRAVAVEALPGWRLAVTFSNGERKQYNAEHLLTIHAFRGLAAVFGAARVEFGTVVWPGDMDIDPDELYAESK